MDLSNELISQFAKLTSDNSKSSETVVYGTVTESEGSMYVIIDGSDILTPITTTANIKDGQRVTVMIKDHTATVTGNITSPSVGNDVVNEAKEEVKIELTDSILEIIADKMVVDVPKVELTGSIKIGSSPSGEYGAFEVSTDGVLRMGDLITNTTVNKNLRALRIDQVGNVRIGGYSAYSNGERAVAEIQSNGRIWSCSKTDPYTYTKIDEGVIEIANTGIDPDYNGPNGEKVLDSYIRFQNGQISIYNSADDKYSSYNRSLYLQYNHIGSAMGRIEFQNSIEITGGVSSTSRMLISQNAKAYRGVDTSGIEVALCHVGGDNVLKYGYGSWNGDSEDCYNKGSEFLGGDKVYVKSKNIIYLGCDSDKYIRFCYNGDDNYIFRPNDNEKNIYCGSSSYPWKAVSAVSVNQTSDRTLKENIKYISNANTINDEDLTINDCYNFIKNDLPLATYNYIHDKVPNKIGFIAQDLLYNVDGSDNKIGQLIIDNLKYTEEHGKLTYDTNNLFGVMLGAMQVMINEIETLKSKLND